MAPASLDEALSLRAERGDEATVLAGGTFLGILMNQGFLTPSAFLSLGAVAELRRMEVVDGELRLGAMITHRRVEREATEWPALARAFGLVASPRVRNQATVGGVLADADYASDPPAMLAALDFPYNALWGFPDKFYAGEPSTTGEVKGLAASPGVVEGPARFVASLDEFDQVKDGEILVCRMTNPAWVVLFTKITGLVTEAGGATSHPAVVAREFGIPAVVGTTNAGERIKTGDRVRVNGATGVVEILG